jgi:YD repeat-containing protein
MTLTYGYDNANQLTSSNGPEGSITYTYDNDGQLTNVGGARTETYPSRKPLNLRHFLKWAFLAHSANCDPGVGFMAG